MRNKLSELNELVCQLVAERETIQKTSHSVPVDHVVENTSVNHKPQGGGGITKTEFSHFKITLSVFVTYLKPKFYMLWCALFLAEV